MQAYRDSVGFERWAAIYGGKALTPRVRRSIRTGHARMLAQASEQLAQSLPTVPEGVRALDAGCGTGLFSLHLAERGFHVTAADIAPRMADTISTTGRLSTLEQMVRLETRTKVLNRKWYEAMLAQGYEGVREIETRVGNTFGWSDTTDAGEN